MFGAIGDAVGGAIKGAVDGFTGGGSGGDGGGLGFEAALAQTKAINDEAVVNGLIVSAETTQSKSESDAARSARIN